METIVILWRRVPVFSPGRCRDLLLNNRVTTTSFVLLLPTKPQQKHKFHFTQLTCMQVQWQVSPQLCWWRRSSPGATLPKQNRAKATVNVCFPATFAIQQLLPSPCTATTIQLMRESGRETASWEERKEERREGGKELFLQAWIKCPLSESWNKSQPKI